MAHLIDLKNILKHDQENLRNKTLEYINDLDDHLVNLKQKKYNEYLQQKAELERYIRANQLTFKTFKQIRDFNKRKYQLVRKYYRRIKVIALFGVIVAKKKVLRQLLIHKQLCETSYCLCQGNKLMQKYNVVVKDHNTKVQSVVDSIVHAANDLNRTYTLLVYKKNLLQKKLRLRHKFIILKQLRLQKQLYYHNVKQVRKLQKTKKSILSKLVHHTKMHMQNMDLEGCLAHKKEKLAFFQGLKFPSDHYIKWLVKVAQLKKCHSMKEELRNIDQELVAKYARSAQFNKQFATLVKGQFIQKRDGLKRVQHEMQLQLDMGQVYSEEYALIGEVRERLARGVERLSIMNQIGVMNNYNKILMIKKNELGCMALKLMALKMMLSDDTSVEKPWYSVFATSMLAVLTKLRQHAYVSLAAASHRRYNLEKRLFDSKWAIYKFYACLNAHVTAKDADDDRKQELLGIIDGNSNVNEIYQWRDRIDRFDRLWDGRQTSDPSKPWDSTADGQGNAAAELPSQNSDQHDDTSKGTSYNKSDSDQDGYNDSHESNSSSSSDSSTSSSGYSSNHSTTDSSAKSD